MDERKSMRSKDDDVPMIGDYSEPQKARVRADAREAPSPPPAPRSDRRARDDQWVLDPRDVHRHARLARQREHRGTLAKLLRYSPIALAAVVAFIVYWNFETLRAITVDFSAWTSLTGRDVSANGGDAPRGGELETVSVEAPVVVGGIESLTGDGDAPPTPEEHTVDEVADETATAATVAADPVSPGEGLASARESPPATPPAPETFAFGVPVTTVSEADAAAAVIILRNGGKRGESSVSWWTSDGSATAGVDYADFGTVVEKFAAGRQNLTIRIPIVGDRVVEGPESFYIHLATSDSAGVSSERTRTEVVINDDE
jgi:hypothetical protein